MDLAISTQRQCFCPPLPWHIREKKHAAELIRHLRSARAGRSTQITPYWQQVNYAESVLRSAIRAHRFLQGNAPVQTFGDAFARRVVERAVA